MRVPITRLKVMIHGADYNPDQWLDHPEILKQDIEYMKKTKMNAVSLGIFAWSALEPEEGVFNFKWMDEIIDELFKNGIYTILATPSGAKPAWLAHKYPEVLRTNEKREKHSYGHRHNHCMTSPIYREKTKIINQELAKRYAKHPGVILWHISNEYGGSCHCELCQEAFRDWLKKKYGTIENLNYQWWNTFWSHTFNSFDQIESPSPLGESLVQALLLDWQRFVSDQTIDFYLHEVNTIKEVDDTLPFTTNFMGTYDGLDYMEFSKHVDLVCWDSYPEWGNSNDYERACWVGFVHDMYRSFKDKPFLLMESTPSMTNWQRVSKLKRPNVHLLSSLHAIAHGSDSVQYFQFRKSRGSYEKFHGAVVDHDCSDTHRVFKDVVMVGESLEKQESIVGTTAKSDVAVIYDWSNKWAIHNTQGPRNAGMNYNGTVQGFHKSFYKNGISVDVIGIDHDFSKYKILVVPMLYIMSEATSEKLADFAYNGGTLVVSYFTGYVNENDLCYLGGFPGGKLREAMGVKVDEIDALYDYDYNEIEYKGKTYRAKELCELMTVETAKVLGEYKKDFYKGSPALTVNEYGEGKVYYIASRNTSDFNDHFLMDIAHECNVKPVVNFKIPKDVLVTHRTDGINTYIFIMSFSNEDKEILLENRNYYDLDDQVVDKKFVLSKYEVKIFKQK